MPRVLEALARAWDHPAIRWPVTAARAAGGLTVLNHHRIAEAVPFDDGVVSATPGEFAWQAAWLRANASVIDGERVLRAVRGERPLDGPAVCLTFDDGYSDNYPAGLLLMSRYRLPAIFFITTGFVETGVVPLWDRIVFAVKHTARERLVVDNGGGRWAFDTSDRRAAATLAKRIFHALPNAQREEYVRRLERAADVRAADAPRKEPLFMSWSQIRHLRELGHTIGAHTHTHPHLASLSPADQRVELARSRAILEEATGGPVRMMAYPFGRRDSFTADTERIAAECGFEAAFAFAPGVNRRPERRAYALRRQSIDANASRRVFRVRAVSHFPF